MPAWGDRMTEAEIQAVVGFIRAWEPTAPEVAEPARTGGGGPWWRTADGTGSPPGKGGSGNGGQGGPPAGAGSGQAQGDTQTNDQPVAVAEDQVAGSPPADAGPPDTAGGGAASGQGAAAADHAGGGQGGPPEGAGGGQSHVDGEIPPWMQPEEPQSWFEAMDLRAWTLVFAVIIMALVLITAAFFGLSRMPLPEADVNEPND